MDDKGTIRTVASALLAHRFPEETGKTSSKAEEIAQKRFLAKLERPDSKLSNSRRINAWDEWIGSDKQLNPETILGPNWAAARLLIHEILKDFKMGPISFTTGSEFTATLGHNSVESRLRKSDWTCTYDNFDLWCDVVYQHHGLKQAMRRRYAEWLAKRNTSPHKLNRFLWLRLKDQPNFQRKIFNFKMECITTFTQGNRFSTVPKNNLVDRPICIESLANILTQRQVGIGIRNCLKQFGIDLDILAFKHQDMISSSNVATIDLKNASDRIHQSLVKYLLPKRVFKFIELTRSAMTLGPDGEYYFINKVSSMGNGFTFELMSLILTALSRTYSDSASVFGDDIIVPNLHAESIIADLTRAGFTVNMGKTHVNSDYRESCGAQFIDGHGYVESYDFRYPGNIGECITIVNKLSRLSLIYPSFIGLYCKVYGAMPATLFAENPTKAVGFWHRKQEPFASPQLDTFTVMSPFQYRKDGLPFSRSAKRKLYRFCRENQLDPSGASMHLGYEWKTSGTTPTDLTPSRHWAKILMYLDSGRRCEDAVRGKGAFKSFLVVTLKNGTTFRWSAIVATANIKGEREPIIREILD